MPTVLGYIDKRISIEVSDNFDLSISENITAQGRALRRTAAVPKTLAMNIHTAPQVGQGYIYIPILGRNQRWGTPSFL